MSEVREEYTRENYPTSGKKYNGERAVISLTSWKARINTVSKTLYSLIKQCPGFHIVLVLSEEEFPQKEKELPENLMVFVENELIELLWAKLNLKPHKKYFYTMQKYRNVPIITCDDDVIILKNFADILYKSYLANPNFIHAGRCHEIILLNHKIQSYKKWIFNQKNYNKPSHKLFATGVGGVLYPPNILNITDADIPLIKELLTVDDIFLKIKELTLNIKVNSVNLLDFKQYFYDISNKNGLWLNNLNGKSLNDFYIKKFNHLFINL